VFASLHELPGTTRSAWPIAGLLRGFCFVMAVAPAWLYRRTGSLWAPVLVHAGNNALALWAMAG
jgi:membrane protease YdiL (CAAX protease family)